MQVNWPRENTTPTLTLTVHGPNHMEWYFQCSHWCIGWPMLLKAWSTSNPVVWASKKERYNNEDKHTPCFKVPTEHKWVQVHEEKSVDLSWCCVTLRATLKHNQTLDYDMQANERSKDNLCRVHVLAKYDSYNAWEIGSCSSSGGSMICVRWIFNAYRWVVTSLGWLNNFIIRSETNPKRARATPPFAINRTS